MRYLIPLSLLLLSHVALAQYRFPVEIIEYMDNTRVVAFVNHDDMLQTPQWQPFHAAPPLSVEAVLKKLKTHLGNKPVRMIELELRQFPNQQKYWHYLVKLAYKVDSKPEFHYFVVLMNGKIIAALKEPESIK